MTKRFPKFGSPAQAQCFSCDAPLVGAALSGFAKGHGEWRADCAKCQMSTWYDVRRIDPMTEERLWRDARLANPGA